jgi:hypothetical protein
MNVCADKNRCAWPCSHRGDRFERFRTSKQTGRNPPIPAVFAKNTIPITNPVMFAHTLNGADQK